MKLAEPRTVTELLQHDKEQLLREWEHHARQLPGADRLDDATLRDHMSTLMDELTRALARPKEAPQHVQAFCAHSEHRLAMGADIAQVLTEYQSLRRCLFEHLEHAGVKLNGTMTHAVNDIIDEGVTAAVDTFAKRRNNEEAKRREEYLSFVVHDLRSPLSAIYYAVQLMERELQGKSLSERAQSIPNTIKRNIERMQALIVKLLQEEQNLRLSANVRAYPSMVELWPIAESAIRTLSPLVSGTTAQINNAIPKELFIVADPELIERVLQNLITNAIENTPSGSVTLGAVLREDDAVECWIKDTGKGISDEIKGRVFEKFQTGKRRGGLGLGLSVVKRVVEAHGGSVHFDSEEGKGATFRFVIPSR